MGSSQSLSALESTEHKPIPLGGCNSNLEIETETEFEYITVEHGSKNEKPCKSGRKYSSDPRVSVAQAEEWEKELLSRPKNQFAMSALMANDIDAVVGQKVATLPDTQTFSVRIEVEGSPVTNQRSSGRCWLFATTNVHRVPIMLRHNLSSFELSQSYLFFWDKLEKANWFLHQIIQTSQHDLSSRLVQTLLAAPVNDGGQWDMANNLVYKYGLVPQVLYPDSYNAMNSSHMGRILTSKLRADALTLRKIANYSHTTQQDKQQKLLAAKEKMLQAVHAILTLMLGPPPKPSEKFTWDYLDKDGKYHSKTLTPLEFAHELYTPSFTTRCLSGANPNNLFSLVNDPRHPYLTHLTVDRLGNVIDGKRAITYINVDMTTMKRAATSMLRANIPVFFGSDVGKFSSSTSGIMDPKLYNYALAFESDAKSEPESESESEFSVSVGNGSLALTKSERLRTGESAMTHAMVLTGVHLDHKTGASVRWRVQNSWGEGPGDKGWFVMSDEWMDEFVYQVVVDPVFVGKEVSECLKKEAVVLPLWDPMGALA